MFRKFIFYIIFKHAHMLKLMGKKIFTILGWIFLFIKTFGAALYAVNILGIWEATFSFTFGEIYHKSWENKY